MMLVLVVMVFVVVVDVSDDDDDDNSRANDDCVSLSCSDLQSIAERSEDGDLEVHFRDSQEEGEFDQVKLVHSHANLHQHLQVQRRGVGKRNKQISLIHWHWLCLPDPLKLLLHLLYYVLSLRATFPFLSLLRCLSRSPRSLSDLSCCSDFSTGERRNPVRIPGLERLLERARRERVRLLSSSCYRVRQADLGP